MTVDYATANGTATSPADYPARSGTLTFTPGQTSQQLTVARQRRPARRGQRDVRPQPHEPDQRDARRRPGRRARSSTTTRRRRCRSTTSPSPRATRARSTRTSRSRLSAPSGQTVSVGYATADGTATRGATTRPPAATSSSPRASRPGTLTVQTIGDTLDEIDETFIGEPRRSGQRDDRRRRGPRHDHRRRRAADDLRRRRHRHRGQLGHCRRHVHGQPQCPERPRRDRRLRDGERHGDARRPTTRRRPAP